MAIFIAVIATINLALGYALAVYLGHGGRSGSAVVTDEAPPTDEEPLVEATVPAVEPSVAEPEVVDEEVASEPPEPAAPAVETQGIAEADPVVEEEPVAETAPVEQSAEPSPAPSEEAVESPDDQGDLLAGIESFRAQLEQSAEDTRQPPPIDAASIGPSADAPEAADEVVDAEVLEGIEAFREQLAMLQGGAPLEPGDPRRKVIRAVGGD